MTELHILDSLRDALFVLDREFRFVYVNPAAARLLGRPPAALAGKSLWAEFPELLGNEAEAAYRAALEQHAAGYFRHYFPSRKKWFEVGLHPVPDGRMTAVLRDVTAAKEAEDRLRLIEQRRREAAESSGVGTWSRDLATGELYWDDINRALFGLKPGAEITRAGVLEVVHPDDRARLAAEAALLEADGGTREFDFRVVWPSGEVHWIRSRATAVRGPSGRVERLHGNSLSIDDRKRLETALAAQARRVQLSHDAIIVADSGRRILSWNQGAWELYGWTEQEAVGQVTHNLLKTVSPVPIGQLDGILALEGRWEGELAHRCRDGRELFVESRQILLREDDGTPEGILEINRDITQRKHSEAELRREYSRTQAITSNAGEAIVMLDSAGLVTYLNPATEAMFGFTRGELLGQPFHAAVHHHYPDGRPYPAGECPINAVCVSGRGLRSYEDVFFRKDGSQIMVSCSTAPVFENGVVAAAVLVVSDISERKRMEQSLLEAQKLESVGLLAGGIAHRFNNLLTGMLGNASLAVECYPDHPAKEMLADVLDAGESLACLTRQLLAYTGKGQFLIERLDVGGIANQAVELVRAGLAKDVNMANVRITLDLAPDSPRIEGDRWQTQQLIINLVTNAVEAASKAESAVVVATAAADVSGTSVPNLTGGTVVPGSYLRLTVRDNGSGMSDALRSRIFDPFFTTKFIGRGLGLPAVLGIVRSHRGFLTLVTEPGAGSTFEVFLPAAQ